MPWTLATLDGLPRTLTDVHIGGPDEADWWVWQIGQLQGGFLLHFVKRSRKFEITYVLDVFQDKEMARCKDPEAFVSLLNDMAVPVPPPAAMTRKRPGSSPS